MGQQTDRHTDTATCRLNRLRGLLSEKGNSPYQALVSDLGKGTIENPSRFDNYHRGQGVHPTNNYFVIF